jgi:hypothetical protein
MKPHDMPFNGSLLTVFQAISCRIFACPAGAEPARDFIPIGFIPYYRLLVHSGITTSRSYHGAKPH